MPVQCACATFISTLRNNPPYFFDIVNRIDDAPSLGASFSLVLKPLKRRLNLSGSLKETKAVRSKLGPVYLGGWS